ncbi:MAG: Uma2 family endonuclease [Labilithrix sp.]|nr:Uma2 family endonuclease [Labilithrix sp.]MCW5812976.1 Uma2 family endonuclease [Labilithrix sp.]
MSANPSSSQVAPPRRLSDEEWAALPEDVDGELVDGVLVEEEAPDYAHEAVVVWLIYVLAGWTRSHGGIVGGSEAKFVLQRGRGRKPDLSMFLPGGAKPPRRGAVRAAPDLMVEVISRASRDVRRDRIEKMDEYAAFGVRWYWLVDPEARTFEIYERTEAGIYARVVGAAEGRIDTVPGLAGLTLDLDDLWSKVDELPEEAPP